MTRWTSDLMADALFLIPLIAAGPGHAVGAPLWRSGSAKDAVARESVIMAGLPVRFGPLAHHVPSQLRLVRSV